MKRSKTHYKRESGKVQVSLLLPEELVINLEKLATAEHRSRNKQVELILSQWFAETKTESSDLREA